jgi:hypothetical protein
MGHKILSFFLLIGRKVISRNYKQLSPVEVRMYAKEGSTTNNAIQLVDSPDLGDVDASCFIHVSVL